MNVLLGKNACTITRDAQFIFGTREWVDCCDLVFLFYFGKKFWCFYSINYFSIKYKFLFYPEKEALNATLGFCCFAVGMDVLFELRNRVKSRPHLYMNFWLLLLFELISWCGCLFYIYYYSVATVCELCNVCLSVYYVWVYSIAFCILTIRTVLKHCPHFTILPKKICEIKKNKQN